MLVPVKKSDSFVFQVAYRLFELRVDQKKNARWPKKHFRQNIVHFVNACTFGACIKKFLSIIFLSTRKVGHSVTVGRNPILPTHNLVNLVPTVLHWSIRNNRVKGYYDTSDLVVVLCSRRKRLEALDLYKKPVWQVKTHVHEVVSLNPSIGY